MKGERGVLQSSVWGLMVAQAALFLVVVGTGVFRTSEASAGHTLGGGDCWQAGTPWTCRENWLGAGQLLYLRVINAYIPSSSTLWSQTQTAYSNWNVPEGAQSFRDYAALGTRGFTCIEMIHSKPQTDT